MTMECIRIDSIRLDGGTQPRGSLSQQQIRRYTADMRAGMTFPPIEVCHDGESYWLWDGFHRVHASRLAGRSEIDANVTPGTQADAQWLSYSANKAHGLYRSNRDKRRAVESALRHAKGAGCSDREIAEHVGVHFDTVAKYRTRLEREGTIGKSDSRTGRDGRKIKTANIGRKRKKGKRAASKAKGNGISPRALRPVRGHSKPNPKTALEMPHDPVYGARTLMSVFDRTYLAELVRELTSYLEGEQA